MKLIIDGDIGEEDLIKIGKFLTDLYHGRKEHVNVNIEGLEEMKACDVAHITEAMFGDVLHTTIIIDGVGKNE
ncbi:hypothetical protein LCGC14_0441710 [marine sediment metagenome]|uniref:Uncharacterized protein n=1 Tax=marine sediment metagenome TaxID=412755 RepID=A0A0F9VUB6_9ZZZZ